MERLFVIYIWLNQTLILTAIVFHQESIGFTNNLMKKLGVNKMHEYIFTFGFGQKLKSGLPADNCYTTISAKDEIEARQIMVSKYSDKWAFCYLS